MHTDFVAGTTNLVARIQFLLTGKLAKLLLSSASGKLSEIISTRPQETSGGLLVTWLDTTKQPCYQVHAWSLLERFVCMRHSTAS